MYLLNRVLWSAFALAGLLLGYWRFHFIATVDSGASGSASRGEGEAPPHLSAAATNTQETPDFKSRSLAGLLIK